MAALGTLFACEHFGIQPDILVLSKQITSSYQPLAAVLVSDALYQGIADQTERLGTFRARLYRQRPSGGDCRRAGEPRHHRGARSGRRTRPRSAPHLQASLRRFADHPLVGEVRGVGLIAAVELVADKASKAKFDPPGKVGLYLFERAHEHGLIIRAMQDSIAFCPPLIITRRRSTTW